MIWIHREEMAEVRSFEAYIRVVAKNQIYTLLRKISYEEKQKEVFNTVVQSSVSNGDFALLDDQNEQLLNTILSKLPLRQQEVYNLSRNEGLSHDVIANRLNISQGTVKNHLVRALNTIRQQLSPYVDTHLMLLMILMTR